MTTATPATDPVPMPDPGAALRRHDDGDVAVLVLDTPGRPVNVVDEGVLTTLAAHLDDVLADDDVVAMVLCSGKEASFGAGADVDWLPVLAARTDAADFLGQVHDLMVRLVTSPKPLVTAINGGAFGGALELALGGAAIVAVPSATLGLPEVSLALLPGGGGTQLLRRWLPVDAAVSFLSGGRPMAAPAAREAGLVTQIAEPADLRATAVALARSLASGDGADATGTRELSAAGPGSPELAAVAAHRDDLRQSRRGLAPAAERILGVVEVGIRDGLAAGLAAERSAFLAALDSAEARAALHLFRAERDVRRRSRGDGSPAAVVGVVGGGQMGAGIAATAVARGLTAIVQDVAQDSLDRARTTLDGVLARSGTRDDAADRWTGTTAWIGMDAADAVVEAVFEDPELKASILAQVAERVGPDALVATNTSAIPIASLAPSVPGPERFMGMHFFSPVDRMPLVELIPHAGTSAATSARAAAVGRQLGKVPVVVGDAPGFFTSRVYARWLIEGVRLVLDGVPVDDVDRAATSVGFPVGPLRAHDEATLTLVLAASIAQVAVPVLSHRLDVDRVRMALEALCEAGCTGRRDGAGFHAYQDGRRTGANPTVARVLDLAPDGGTDLDQAVVADRLLLAFVTECLACWDDGTLCHPDDGDVASVLGIGFPRVLGGPFHWVDEVGAATVVARAQRLGPQFPVGDSLRRLARTGATFGDEARRPAPFAPPGG